MSETLVGPGGTIDRAGRSTKAASAFRTISEVADELDVAQHVLRFWESKFPQVRPLKRGGGRRYYRPEDIDLLRRIRSLLYDEGYTIKGVQKLLRVRRRDPAGPAEPPPSGPGTADTPLIGSQPTPEPARPVVPKDTPQRSADPVPGSQTGTSRAAAHDQSLREIHAELLALAKLAAEITEQLKPALSEREDSAIDPPARSVAQPG